MKGQLYIQDASGHTTVEWDTEVHDGPLDPKVAEAKFNQMVGNGAFAFASTNTPEGKEQREQVRRFDPETQTRVTIVPQIAGG